MSQKQDTVEILKACIGGDAGYYDEVFLAAIADIQHLRDENRKLMERIAHTEGW